MAKVITVAWTPSAGWTNLQNDGSGSSYSHETADSAIANGTSITETETATSTPSTSQTFFAGLIAVFAPA